MKKNNKTYDQFIKEQVEIFDEIYFPIFIDFIMYELEKDKKFNLKPNK